MRLLRISGLISLLFLGGVILVFFDPALALAEPNAHLNGFDPRSLEKEIEITDSCGRRISIDLPVKKISCLHTSSCSALALLGVEDRVCGVCSYLKNFEGMYPGLSDKPVIGNVYTPSYELILQHRPDLLVMSTSPVNLEPVIRKLEPLGIKVVALDVQPNKGENFMVREASFNRELMTLAKIVEKEDRAAAYIRWKNQIIDQIKVRTEGVRKKRVLSIQYPGDAVGYKSFSVWGGRRIIPIAGGINIAENYNEKSMSPEWILEQNPEVIVVRVSFPKNGLGYNIDNSLAAEKSLSRIMNDRVLKKTRAGRAGQVWLYGYYGTASGGQSPIGALYLAKKLYPKRFENVDPQDTHRVYFERWFHIPYKGLWFYP